jgi:hypothetical protein
MADQTISCETSCYTVDHEQVEKKPGDNIVIAAPKGAVITWDSGTPVTPPLSKAVQASGQVSWGVTARATAGTYSYTPTGMDCDSACPGTKRPSVRVR